MYKPNYGVTDIDIPNFLFEYDKVDPGARIKEGMVLNEASIELENKKREAAARDALSKIDTSLPSDIRDREIENILMSSGDIDAIRSNQESMARQNQIIASAANSAANATARASTIPNDRAIQDLVAQYGGAIPASSQYVPNRKLQDVGGEAMVFDPRTGGIENLGTTANYDLKKSKGGGSGSGRKFTAKDMVDPTTGVITQAKTEEQVAMLEDLGFIPSKFAPKRKSPPDEFGDTEEVPWDYKPIERFLSQIGSQVDKPTNSDLKSSGSNKPKLSKAELDDIVRNARKQGF